MRISRHARDRFTLRIDATVNAYAALCEVFNASRIAKPDELNLYTVRVDDACEYRIGTYQHRLTFIMVVRNNTITTILDRQAAPYSTAPLAKGARYHRRKRVVKRND